MSGIVCLTIIGPCWTCHQYGLTQLPEIFNFLIVLLMDQSIDILSQGTKLGPFLDFNISLEANLMAKVPRVNHI